MNRRVLVLPDARTLAAAVAGRLILTVLDAQADRGTAAVVLTGGTIAAQAYATVREHPLRDAVDWTRVDLWWGDERFLPTGHPDRNDTQARAALLEALDLDPARVHPMPASDGPDGPDAGAGAVRYARELALRPTQRFDLLLLGVGPDGHVASVFPDHPMVTPDAPVSAVHDSPKPPPTRITLTLPTIRTAAEVWLIAAGAGKAAAVSAALSSTGPALPDRSTLPDRSALPASLAHGTERTLWLLDRAAAPPADR